MTGRMINVIVGCVSVEIMVSDNSPYYDSKGVTHKDVAAADRGRPLCKFDYAAAIF